MPQNRQKFISKRPLEPRAEAAFLRNDEAVTTSRDIRVTHTVKLGALTYVVIEGHTKRLAVYRVASHNGFLRLLKRWPTGLPLFSRTLPDRPTSTYFDPFADQDPFAGS